MTTAAVAMWPEFGTVGPELIREAAKEAVEVADLLVVAGFAFDPRGGESSTVSRPFPRPMSRKIAVKVVNHYGTRS